MLCEAIARFLLHACANVLYLVSIKHPLSWLEIEPAKLTCTEAPLRKRSMGQSSAPRMLRGTGSQPELKA
jgi:hypothetical protein